VERSGTERSLPKRKGPGEKVNHNPERGKKKKQCSLKYNFYKIQGGVGVKNAIKRQRKLTASEGLH